MKQPAWYHRFCRDDRGASLGEYAVLLAVVAVALIVVLARYRSSVSTLYASSSDALSAVAANGASSGGSASGGNNGGGNNGGGNNGGGNNGGGNNGGGNRPVPRS